MKYLIPLIMLVLIIGCGDKNDAKMKIEESKKLLSELNSLWDYDNPAETEKKFRELLQKAKESGNVDYQAQLLTQLARALGMQGKFEEAHKTLDEVKLMISDKLAHAKMRYLLERGRLFNSVDNTEEAKKLFLEAYDFGTKNNIEYYTFDAIHMLGIAGTKEEQIKWNLKAIELLEKTTNPKLKSWIGPVYNNLAWSYHDGNQYDEALKYFEKSLEYWTKNGKPEDIFRGKWALARCYRSLNRVDEALKIQIALEKEMNEEGISPFGYVYDELGELYLLKNNETEAYKNFKYAYDLLTRLKENEWLQINEPEHWNRIKGFAEKAK